MKITLISLYANGMVYLYLVFEQDLFEIGYHHKVFHNEWYKDCGLGEDYIDQFVRLWYGIPVFEQERFEIGCHHEVFQNE